MERSKTQTVNELFGNLLEQEPDLHEGLLEQKALLFFKEQLGDYLRDIVNIHITNGTIYIYGLTPMPSCRLLSLAERISSKKSTSISAPNLLSVSK